MSVGLIILCSIGTAIGAAVYLFSISTIMVFPHLFHDYPYEVFGMITNGLIGIIGYSLYVANIPISGGVNSVDEIMPDSECQYLFNCASARQFLFDYQVMSTFRFVCWYCEYLCSYIYIIVFKHFVRTMCFLRYTIHTVNVILSIVTLYIVSLNDFPKQFILGSRAFAPVMAQSLILVWVLISYWFIAQSKLYRSACISNAVALRFVMPFNFILSQMRK